MSQDDAIARLVELGLNRNEAQAYVALVEMAGPEGVTGYEIGLRSGVPRSAVYRVLTALEQRGGAFSVGRDPARWIPTDPERFIGAMQQAFTIRAERATEGLRGLGRHERPEPVFTIARYDDVLVRIDAMVREARHSVLCSLWSRELDRLAPAFAAIADRPVHRVLHSPGPVPQPPPGFSVWAADIPVGDPKSTWSHKAIVVVDRKVALIGGVEPGADNHAVWTTNPSLVDLATDHLVLDLTLLARAQGRSAASDVERMLRPDLGPT